MKIREDGIYKKIIILGFTFYDNFSIQKFTKIFMKFIKFLRSTHIITNKNIKKI